MTGLNGVLAPTLGRNGPLWSLAYEIWFYIVGGALAYIAVNRTSIVAICTLAISTAIFSILSASFLLYWGFGALMILFIDAKHKSWLFFAGIAFVVIGSVSHELSFPSKSFVNVSYIPIEASRALLCIGACLSLPFLCSKSVDTLLGGLRRPARIIAAGSYTLYLVHYPVLSALDTIFPRFAVLNRESLVYFLVRIAICITVTICSISVLNETRHH